MTRRLVFADSEVAAVRVADGALHVRFAAAHVRQADPGSFLGWSDGHVAGVALIATGGAWPVIDTDQVGRLAMGRVVDTGGAHVELPLPFETDAPAWLELRFANGARLEVALMGLRVTAPDGAAFTESLAC